MNLVRSLIKTSVKYGQQPILCGGDFFDRWNPSLELVNHLISSLLNPNKLVSIVGQHDLPQHRKTGIKKTGFYNLLSANKVTWLESPNEPHRFEIDDADDIKCLVVYGFNWGDELAIPKMTKKPGVVNVAVVHKYVWLEGHTFPNAPEDGHAEKVCKALSAFDFILTGDNHSRFIYQSKAGPLLYNPGSFMIRKADELQLDEGLGFLLWNHRLRLFQVGFESFQNKKPEPITTVTTKEKLQLSTNTSELLSLLQENIEATIDFSDFIRKALVSNRLDADVVAEVNVILERIKR